LTTEDQSQPEIPLPSDAAPSARRNRWLGALLAASLLINVIVLYRMHSGESPTAPAAGVEEKKDHTGAQNSEQNDRVELSAEAVKRAGIESREAALIALDRVIEAPGRLAVNADASARVGSFVEGRVTRVTVVVGDAVKQDQPVVYIHSHEVAQARADYARAHASIIRSEKSLEQARIELARADRLLEAKALSPRERMQAEAALNAAQADLAQARAEEHRAEEFLHHLGASPTGEDDAVVRAPQSGVVLERLVTPGTAVTPATDLLRIADLSTLWAVAEVPETQASGVHTGQAVEIAVAAFPDVVFAGRVIHIGDMLSATTRTIQVRCLVRNTGGRLRPEMFAQIRIAAGAGRQALAVPRDAVAESAGERFVFIDLGGGAFAKRVVETGIEYGDRVEILSGLQPGERIAVRGTFYLKSALLKSALSDE
jgi:cobalt-zinc-cadmium efflux system membrane fusion protein